VLEHADTTSQTDQQANVQPLEMHLASVEALLVRILQAVEPPPEGLTPAEAAKLVGVSVSKFHAMNDDGRIPAAVKFGDRLPRWSRGELTKWMQSGAPPRSRWEGMRASVMRNAM